MATWLIVAASILVGGAANEVGRQGARWFLRRRARRQGARWFLRRRARRAPAPRLHPDGVPVGLRPGDPIPRENVMAIFEFVERHGTHVGDVGPGEVRTIQPPPPREGPEP